MKTPQLKDWIPAVLVAFYMAGCEPSLEDGDISKRVESIICETSIPGQFTQAGPLNLASGRFSGRDKKVRGSVVVEDVKKGAVGYWEHQGGVLEGHPCTVENRLPKVLASFNPRKQDIVVSDQGNLHFQASRLEDLTALTTTHSVPQGLRRNDGENWNHLWVIDPQVNEDHPDHQYFYEVADNNRVHGGFVATVEALAQAGFGTRLTVSSYATLYDQGTAAPMTLDQFLSEVK